MRRRYKEAIKFLDRRKPGLGHALRGKLKEGYKWNDFRADMMAGAIVAMVAMPLAMALAIASGVPPQYGLYTAIVAGFAVALLGGSRCQVTGPTAAFVVVLSPIVHQFGMGGLLVAVYLAGLILMVLGVARMGRFIGFIPHPVTTGFTAGIAVVIATLQLKDFFGLRIPQMPEVYHERLLALFNSRGTWQPAELAVGLITLILLVVWPRINKKIPAPLIVLGFVTVVVIFLKKYFPNLEIATIETRFQGIPQALPSFAWPWDFVGPDGKPFAMTFDHVRILAPSAFTIAILGAIESLLSAVVADSMTRTRHDPDSELVALGVGNMFSSFFGGIAATGAIARTATNIRYGARSPFAAAAHALFILFSVLLFAPYVSQLPMAALAGLLMLVAYNISDIKSVSHILRVATRSDTIVLLICFSLTVIFDMVTGVFVGLMMAAFLFMRRMAYFTTGEVVEERRRARHATESLPKEVMLYKISGPLFFGGARRAVHAIDDIADNDVKAVIFIMEEVPIMDITGLVSLQTAVHNVTSEGRIAMIAGLQTQPKELIERDGSLEDLHDVELFDTVDEAIRAAKKELGLSEPLATVA